MNGWYTVPLTAPFPNHGADVDDRLLCCCGQELWPRLLLCVVTPRLETHDAVDAHGQTSQRECCRADHDYQRPRLNTIASVITVGQPCCFHTADAMRCLLEVGTMMALQTAMLLKKNANPLNDSATVVVMGIAATSSVLPCLCLNLSRRCCNVWYLVCWLSWRIVTQTLDGVSPHTRKHALIHKPIPGGRMVPAQQPCQQIAPC